MTMPTRDEVQALLERVMAATGPDQDIDAEIALAACSEVAGWVRHPNWAAMDPKVKSLRAELWLSEEGFLAWRDHNENVASVMAPPYTSSIDAILALIEKELPAVMWSACIMEEGPYAQVLRPMPNGGYVGGLTQSSAATVPLALCAAFLSAKLAQMQEGE